MTTEQIDRFLSQNETTDTPVRISFRTRNAVTGVFITTPDFEELKLKNFWRIVDKIDLVRWKKSKDYNLCRMFNGAEFTKLAIVQ
ncbi:MAG TPA: hypothetical protein VG842_09860 [Sediminibacterium sp.]|nr:hypothetical protein [Sediminibacterium sp.]